MSNKIIIWINLHLLIFVCLTELSCQKEKKEQKPTIHVHFNKLNITWKGLSRIEGIFPVLENTKLKYHEVVHKEDNDSVFSYEFLHNFEDHVAMKATLSKLRNVIVLYLSPNNYHTKTTTDFVGVFFEKAPGFLKGLVVPAQDSTNVWGSPRHIAAPYDIDEHRNQLLIWKYADGNYGVCFPLSGKGYVGKIGKHQGLIGVKSYDAEDGSDESNIPIMAIAFGTSQEEALNNIYNEVKGLSNQLKGLESFKRTSHLIQ